MEGCKYKRNHWLNAHENTVTGFLEGRIGPGSEYHCSHGDNELSTFTVLDMRPLNYMTLLLLVTDEVAVRYTDYVIPSGTGSRIVTYMDTPFRAESGDPLPPESAEEHRLFLTEAYTGQLNTLTEMADRAAQEMAPA